MLVLKHKYKLEIYNNRLEEENYKLKNLVQYSGNEWIICDIALTELYYSAGLQDLLGYEGEIQTFGDLLSMIEAEGAQLIKQSLEGFSAEDDPFNLIVKHANGQQVFEINGCFAEFGKKENILLWWRDSTHQVTDNLVLQEENKTLENNLSVLETTLDNLPFPVWRRSSDDHLDYCNKSYARAMQTTKHLALKLTRKLWEDKNNLNSKVVPLTNASQRHVVIDGARQLLQFTEHYDHKHQMIFGFATNLSEVEQMARDLKNHINAYKEVLENLSAGITIYGADKRLKFFNHAYSRMFEFDEQWLNGEPTIGEVLDDLRSRRQLTECDDYLAYKKKEVEAVTSLITPFQEIVHLPDERTIRKITSPHPMGGSFYIFEDVTNTMTLERQFQTQRAVEKTTLDNLYEGVAVFGGDNRLRLCNTAFARLWNLPDVALKPGTHLTEIVEYIRPLFDSQEDWEQFKLRMISRVTDRVPKKRRIHRQDNKILDFSYMPLPDGSHLTSYIDITDSCRMEKVLRERNQTLEVTDHIKSEFIAQVSYELRDPLNAIIGFTEILNNQYFGKLNPKQKDYCQNVLESSHHLLRLVNDILDLASIETGQMKLNLQELNPYKILKSIRTLVMNKMREKKIHLTLSCDKDIAGFMGDEARIKQILYTLSNFVISNAPFSGDLTIGAEQKEQMVHVFLRDFQSTQDLVSLQSTLLTTPKKLSNLQKESEVNMAISLVRNLIELHQGTMVINEFGANSFSIECCFPIKEVADKKAL